MSDKRAAEAGLPKCGVGFENTIVIDVPPCQHAEATNITNTLLSTDLFRSFDAKSAIDLLLVSTRVCYEKGHVISTDGSAGSHLWIVQSGTVQMERDCMKVTAGSSPGRSALTPVAVSSGPTGTWSCAYSHLVATALARRSYGTATTSARRHSWPEGATRAPRPRTRASSSSRLPSRTSSG